VPGYAAPADTIGPASRTTLVLGRILADAHAAGLINGDTGPRLPADLRAELERVADAVGARVGEAAIARGMIAWTQLFGALSFELFGQLNNVIEARGAWFDHQVLAMAAFIGLPAPRA
jgi:hypothetical protein